MIPDLNGVVERGDVRVAAAPASRRYSLRARDAAVLERVTGLALPAAIGETRAGVVRLGPDEWHARISVDAVLPSGEGEPVSVVDISSRAVNLIVEGPRAAALLMTGCPLDLEKLAVGRATRTVFELVEIVLWREDADRFCVEVWRSFAPWLWGALAAAA